jgi:hypothetical protein
MYRPSRDDSIGVDAGTMRLLYLAGFGGLAILAGLAVYILAGHSHSDTVPIVQADQRPLRVKPENPGGMAVAPEETASDPSQSRLAPGTEEPNLHALLTMPDPAKSVAPPPVLSPPHARSITVQLMAVRSEADARAAWEKLAKKAPELLGSHHPLFQKTNEAGPTPWRLRTGGFADPVQAKAFCDKVKAKGGQCAMVDS